MNIIQVAEKLYDVRLEALKVRTAAIEMAATAKEVSKRVEAQARKSGVVDGKNAETRASQLVEILANSHRVAETRDNSRQLQYEASVTEIKVQYWEDMFQGTKTLLDNGQELTDFSDFVEALQVCEKMCVVHPGESLGSLTDRFIDVGARLGELIASTSPS